MRWHQKMKREKSQMIILIDARNMENKIQHSFLILKKLN